MSNEYLQKKKVKEKGLKYGIFNFILLCCFFMFAVIGGVGVKAVDSFEIYQSNHEGNNKTGAAGILGITGLGNDAYYNKDADGNPVGSAYVQTTGQVLKDTVSFTVVVTMPEKVSATYTISGDKISKGGNEIATIVDNQFTIGSVKYTKDGNSIKVGETEVATVSGETFTLTIDNTVNGVTVFESNFVGNTSASYDSYKKDQYGKWESLESVVNGYKKGLVLNEKTETKYTSLISSFVTTAAKFNELEANDATAADDGFYSLFYISQSTSDGEITVTLNYVYTLRSSGWGTKTINVALYNDAAYDSYGNLLDPTPAHYRTLNFIASKPINEFEETIIDATGETCGTFEVSDGTADGKITLSDICITYINANTISNDKNGKPMNFVLPKEVAYKHNVSTPAVGANPSIANIISQSIYGINSFSNAGSASGKYVKYYYWNFINATNDEMLPSVGYEMTLMVDSTGKYKFEIRDAFGNEFVSSDVTVSDIEITNIIVDHTGAEAVNIMASTGKYGDGGWKQEWTFAIDATLSVEFDRVKADQVNVEFHVFQKRVIKLGVFASDVADEDIAKQPHSHDSVASGLSYESRYASADVLVWRIADPDSDQGHTSSVITDTDEDKNYLEHMTDGVSCGTGTEINCQFAVGDYGDGASKNKITFTVKNNGRYRVMITDSAGNTTNTTEYNKIDATTSEVTEDYTNPKVEVSVIDRTDPVISSSLTGASGSAASTSIKSHDYVIGGGNGEQDIINPNYVDASAGNVDSIGDLSSDYYKSEDYTYTAIYYNSNGLKAFTYQDALEIAKIQIVDDVYYYTAASKDNKWPADSYEVSFNKGGSGGVYADPSSSYKSDRVSGGSAEENLHAYIINHNITSFTGGLVKKVGYTKVANADINGYSKINNSTADLTYVNGSGNNFYSSTTFLGYLGIEFQIKISDGTYKSVCELQINTTNDNATTSDDVNKACFEKMNKIIDDVEDFRMIFSAEDFVGNKAEKTYTVDVRVVDNTKPGINFPSNTPIKYTNTYSGSTCRLEIGVAIQDEKTLLDCYGISNSSTYYVKDNNVYSADSKDYNSETGGTYKYNMSDVGVQYYGDGVSAHNYITKIKTSVKEGTADFVEINNTVLNKSGDHMIKLEISDHWKNTLNSSDTSVTKDNVLTIIVNYYVNPKTLLIEPLANEKMYGEEDPTFDYCVYINKTNSTFYYESYFFDKNFVNTYFNYIYCTKDVYVEMDSNSIYKATQSTAAAGYTYNSFSQETGLAVNTAAIDGKYLKVNNTYVGITSAQRYTMTYAENAAGEYFGYDTNSDNVADKFVKILSGNKFTTNTCLTAYTGNSANGYWLRTADGCMEVASDTRYNKSYSQSATGNYLKYNNVASTDVLVSGDSFVGKLARVESSCYNSYGTIDEDSTEDNIVLDDLYTSNKTKFDSLVGCAEQATDASHIRNDNVGQYNIVLGTLSISRTGDSSNYNKDYVIKINTNYWSSGDVTDDTSDSDNKKQTTATKTDYGNEKSRNVTVDGKLVDDEIKEESVVKFTIRQAVLTVTANGGNKKFGEQDSFSNNWADTTSTAINNSSSGYLGGYAVSGWRNGDTNSKNIILGTLRRKIGEDVGTYRICNLNGNPASTTELGGGCSDSAETVGLYDATEFWHFTSYANYKTGGTTGDGTTDKAALTINTNDQLYGTNNGRRVNTGTRNYAIAYQGNIYQINPGEITVQPGVNQGKEYAKSAYSDPLWQLVVYGETITNNSGSWATNIKPSEETTEFNGYTTTYNVETYTTYSQGQVGTQYAGDSEIYFARRKTSHDATYTYVVPVTVDKKYKVASGIYYEDAAGTYIYAYGQYHDVGSAAISATTNITVTGRLVNQTYTLFSSNFVLERDGNNDVGWFEYVEINNIKYDTDNTTVKYYTLKQNSNAECVIAANSVSVSTTGTVACTNYNVNYTDIAPATTGYTDNQTSGQPGHGALSDGDTITALTTTYVANRNDRNVEYKPDGINSCNDGGDSDDKAYSSPCSDALLHQITFEVFKREIHLEFVDYNYTFVYGNRYDWYDTNIMKITDANKNTKEGEVFLCYSDLGDYVVDCTTDADYGITAGDSWPGIGLEFHLHSSVSATGSGYYTTGTDKAIPAGMYYVYSSISNAAAANYKYVYKGGTLTVNPKVTSIELTGYTMEYGETYYSSYGTGTDYTNYALQSDECRIDSNFTTSSNVLIANGSGCSITTANEHGNIYGFVVEGLDTKDSIAENFEGRPTRAAGENVGVYAINPNTIANIKNTLVKDNSGTTDVTEFKECESLDGETCTFVTKTASGTNTVVENGKNYDISYSKTNNEGSYLFITPATLTIEVLEGQTKMYGCAYYQVITDHEKYYEGYTYQTGYTSTNCNTTVNSSLDLAYQYTVSGDKKVNGGNSYTVTTNTSDGTVVTNPTGLTSSLDNTTRLYRILKSADNVYDYSDVRDQISLYQGQKVGLYTITLGNLDVSTNGNEKCDAYNNPAANGTYNCKNYNINYYGNSTSKDEDVDKHKYTETTKVLASSLALYTLNYTADTNGSYVLINGKFVDTNQFKTSDTDVIVNDYIDISSARYKKLAQYEEITESSCSDASKCYIKLNGSYVTVASIAGNRYPSATGGEQNNSGAYLKVGNEYIKLSTITKFKQNTEAYASDSNGDYVLVNGVYVEWADLVRYSATTSNGVTTYTEASDTTHTIANGYKYVLAYKTVAVSSLTRYSLDITDATEKTFASGATTGKNVYAFINGSYVPYSSLELDAENKVTVNSANTKNESDIEVTRGTVTTDLDFTIIARKVFVHAEFNIKAYAEADPVEYITCTEIGMAYGLADDEKGARSSYCSSFAESDGKKLDLGVSMYYAVQNSLAKAPWTAWTDTGSRKTSEVAGDTTYRSDFNDIQYDVLTGSLKRAESEIAGKYTFDFSEVTNVGTINGANYMIVHITEMDNGTDKTSGTGDGNGMENTYVKYSDGGSTVSKKLSEVMYTYCDVAGSGCKFGDSYVASDSTGRPIKLKNNAFKLNVSSGVVVDSGGTLTSISLIDKFTSSDFSNRISYWHLGFYKEDAGSDRVGELAKWWNNRDPFKTSYDTFKLLAHDVSITTDDDPYFVKDRPVYFEIVKRTIYLYAVDTEKVYGEQDKYRNFLVAICPNADGYTIDDLGNVKCKNEDVTGSTFTSAYGLGSADYDRFIGEDKIMNQDTIRGITATQDYLIAGTPSKEGAFGIYFRRAAGEDAGIYEVTACATQTDVTDCTDPNLQEEVNTPVNYIGDNYKIIEISGVLTIKTREVKVTPDSGQGFVYGNYTEDGSMPNITFTEAHEHSTTDSVVNSNYASGSGLVFGDGVYLIASGKDPIKITNNEFTESSKNYKIDGLSVINKTSNVVEATITVTANGNINNKTLTLNGTTYKIIQKSRCLINISGLSITCLNDAQNEQLKEEFTSADTAYYEYVGFNSTDLATALDTEIYKGENKKKVSVHAADTGWGYSSYNVYADVYSNPSKHSTRKEANSNSALDLLVKDGNDDYTVGGYRFSRDVYTYGIGQGSLTISDNVLKSTEIYMLITSARLYSRSGSEEPYTYTAYTGAEGENIADFNYFKYGNQYIDISSATKYKEVCTETESNVTCEYQAAAADATGDLYIKISNSVKNYAIKTFDNTVTYTISPADIKVTPGEKQYKIYGEADVEIEFTVETTYTVKNTHYSNNATNIKQICNGGTCYTDLTDYKNASGHVLLTAGWVVTLNNYAYKEYTNDAGTTEALGNLDYGKNTAATKHAGTEVSLSESTSGADHYDKYTDYKATIETSRILIGNLYVNEFDQTVGEKAINGDKIIVAKNILNEKNYTYVSTDTDHYVSKLFVIIPRPVNVQITNVTKTYGQATDSTSCESYDTECIVGDGILDTSDSTNDSKLVNNFTIVTNRQTLIGAGAIEIDAMNVKGIQVIYYRSTDANKLAKMNMPHVTSGTIDSDYTSYVTATSGKYYTATFDNATDKNGVIETKNGTLDIDVNRENKNIARDSDSCLVAGETIGAADGKATGCEDVGEYYLKFVKKLNTTNAIESTLVTGADNANEAYGNAYWGYNPNYYVIVYKNFEASGWDANNGGTGFASKALTANTDLLYSTANAAGFGITKGTGNADPAVSATLKIRKRPVEIVVETISEYTYEKYTGAEGQEIAKFDYLNIGTEESPVYRQITRTNVYKKLASGKYSQLTLSGLSSIPTDSYLCTYVEDNKNVDSNCYAITNSNRVKRISHVVGEKYSIQQTMHVLELPTKANGFLFNGEDIGENADKPHTTYKYITWNEHNRQVRTADALNGEVAYCKEPSTLNASTGLDGIRTSATTCAAANLRYYTANVNKPGHAEWFDTSREGHYIITRETNRLYIGSSDSITDGAAGAAYEANNYDVTFINGILQIDKDETPPIINVGLDFVQKEANGGVMTLAGSGSELSFLNDLLTDKCVATKDATPNCTAANFTYESDTDRVNAGAAANYTHDVSVETMSKLLDWFDINSFDPSVMRDTVPVQNNYFPRWYMAIQADFDQRKVGDYTIFIYAQDLSGNTSLATTVTLRIIDETKPEVGTLNLYDAKVKCTENTDCSKEENWVVAEDTYLPILNLDESKLTAAIKAKKYIRSNKSYILNNTFGTYYLIPAGTDASAVKHIGWTNAEDGIYLTITGGDDNSLSYLNTNKYVKYNVAANDASFTSGSGEYILLGSLIDVSHITKYRIMATSAQTGGHYKEVNGGTTNMFIPDKEGTIIRYKGYWYDLANGKYLSDSGADLTAPTNKEYTVKLYALSSGTYTLDADGKAARTAVENSTDRTEYVNYYLLDGAFFKIPNDAEYYSYDATNKLYKRDGGSDANGRYIDFAQWDNYYSRDGGHSWAKYDRDTGVGYLALNQDGQRLIMIKTVDQGYKYQTTDITKTFIDKAYCYDVVNEEGEIKYICDGWDNIITNKGYVVTYSGSTLSKAVSADGKYVTANGAKTMLYNISDWATYDEDGTQDVKYAYLDTIGPDISLENKFIEVYEYGCGSNCQATYGEDFGTAADGYLFKLDNLTKYNSSGVATSGGTYVKINGELIEVVGSRRYNISGETITQANDGTYIYLGKTDAVIAIDDTITKEIKDYTSRSFSVYNNVTKAKETLSLPESVSYDTTNFKENAETIAANTKKLQSGLGTGSGVFDGTKETISFGTVESGVTSYVGDKYTQIDIYVDVRDGQGAISNHGYLSGQGYYKFRIESSGAATPTYSVYKCYSASTSIGVNSWCGSTTPEKTGIASVKVAIDAILKVYDATNAINFNGNDITFTIDYRVFDLAGNDSIYLRKAILLTSFTRTILGINGLENGAAASSLNVELAQNEDPTVALSNFKIITANGSNIRSDEKITQTIYYNGEVVSENQDYNLTALANLDTTVPGTYKIVYSIARREGTGYVQGNSVELIVNIKPDVATTNSNNIDYKQIIISAFIASSAMLVFAYIYMVSKKKKVN